MKSNRSNSQIVKRLIGFVDFLIYKIVIAVIFAVMGFFTSVLIPVILVELTFMVLAGKSISYLVLGILIILGILRGLFRYGEHYYGHYVAFRVLANYRQAIFRKLRHLAPAKLDQQDSGKLLKMIGEDVEALEVFFAHTLAPLTTASIITILLIPYYWRVNWLLAVIALLTYLLVAVVFPIVFANHLKPLLTKQNSERKQYMALFLESLKGMTDLLQYFTVKQKFNELDQKSQEVNQCERQVAMSQYIQMANSFFAIGLGISAFALVGVYLVEAEKQSLVQVIKAFVVFSSSFAPYLELSRLPLGFKRSILAAEHVFSLLDEVEPIKSGKGLYDVKINTIEVKNVSFSYQNRSQEILEQVNLSVEGPQMVGIIGESGSGKSTLMKLLMNWYQASSGQIIYNQQYREIAMDDLQSHFAYIPQIPQIFHQTIRENVTFGNRFITDEQILTVAKKCHLKERILQTEKGLDTVLSAEQKIFSSGELQRLELMRALLKDAEVYIFDEPTSNLDSLNEASLLQVIKSECQGIVFMISHRPSTVASCDQIYKMCDGQLYLVKGER
ncbi:ATP-binding cassette, subfamily C [Granulicatella balaenopterae]|uniref:ATP-binding cassette, subfamily C n=1 Tax=Granulicatella balaenopterae TaxID=137733 RepID=A0A1H9LA40_9LACT|nr:ABC transporter ATP-binding protein [Granulicatella balaenopterae]SER08306.1 ATP-binding cassette, subfamily C [Granulicatella balaenopterae]